MAKKTVVEKGMVYVAAADFALLVALTAKLSEAAAGAKVAFSAVVAVALRKLAEEHGVQVEPARAR